MRFFLCLGLLALIGCGSSSSSNVVDAGAPGEEYLMVKGEGDQKRDGPHFTADRKTLLLGIRGETADYGLVFVEEGGDVWDPDCTLEGPSSRDTMSFIRGQVPLLVLEAGDSLFIKEGTTVILKAL